MSNYKTAVVGDLVRYTGDGSHVAGLFDLQVISNIIAGAPGIVAKKIPTGVAIWFGRGGISSFDFDSDAMIGVDIDDFNKLFVILPPTPNKLTNIGTFK